MPTPYMYSSPTWNRSWADRFYETYAAHRNDEIRRMYEIANAELRPPNPALRDIDSPPAPHMRQSIHIIAGRPTCGCVVFENSSPWSGAAMVRIDLCEAHSKERVVYVEKPVEKRPVQKYPKRKIIKD